MSDDSPLPEKIAEVLESPDDPIAVVLRQSAVLNLLMVELLENPDKTVRECLNIVGDVDPDHIRVYRERALRCGELEAIANKRTPEPPLIDTHTAKSSQS